MADLRTLEHYQTNAERYVELYERVSVPRLEGHLLSFFHEGGLTLDVGCASGRDLATLIRLGFQAEGLDAVEAFVETCRSRFLGSSIYHDALPQLSTLLSDDETTRFEGRYDNLLVSAVLMHIPREEIQHALSQLARLLRGGGRALISVRSARRGYGDELREGERLFSALPLSELSILCEHLGLRAIYSDVRQEPDEGAGDETRSGKRWVTLVVEKALESDRRGLERVQMILLHDKKTSSYKFALLRALCELARAQPFSVEYDQEHPVIWVPITLIAHRWILYYWGLCHHNHAQPLQQQTNKGRRLRVAAELDPLFEEFPLPDIELATLSEAISVQLEGRHDQSAIAQALRGIARAIKKMPMRYITSHDGEQLFTFKSRGEVEGMWREGAVGVPVDVWFDLRRFWHWVDDSLIMRWADFNRALNGITLESSLDRLQVSLDDAERSTYLVRSLWQDENPHCVWSGAELARFDVDHLIPYSVRRRNELWNLFPTSPSLNRQKSDAAPTLKTLRDARARIIAAWSHLHRHLGIRFEREVRFGLGVDLSALPPTQGFDQAFDRLSLLVAGYLLHAQVRGWSSKH